MLRPQEQNNVISIPGFGTVKKENYESLMDQNKQTGYDVTEIVEYDKLRSIFSDFFKTEPTLTSINRRVEQIASSRKKTEDDYDQIYSEYFYAIRSLVQSRKFGVYESSNDGTVSKLIPLDTLAKLLTSSFVGFDCLEDARNDPDVTDVYCMSYDYIIVERGGHNVKYEHQFRSESDYRNFVSRLLNEDNKQLDQGEHKIVDAEVYGIRINAIHPIISSKGITLTLRKHSEDPITLENMVDHGMLTQMMADFCKMTIRGALNGCVAGVTGSGKTTFLKAVFEASLGNGDPNYYEDKNMNRVITVEDTPELFLRVPHTVALHTMQTGEEKTTIDLRGLNIASLRMKPHYIIVGEIRGVEAASYVEAAATGHSSWTSIHAGTVWSGIDRFVDKYGMVMPNLSNEAVERIIGSSVNLFFMVDNIPGVGRRITAIHELVFDHDTNRVQVNDIVRFEYEKGFVWHNTLSNESIDMMLRRGVSHVEINNMMAKIKEQIDRSKKEEDGEQC